MRRQAGIDLIPPFYTKKTVTMALFMTKWAAFADAHKDAFTHLYSYGILYKGMYGIWEGEGSVFMRYIFRGERYQWAVYNLTLTENGVRVYGPLREPNPIDLETDDPEEAHRAILARQRVFDLAKSPRREVAYRPVWVDNPSLGPRPADYRLHEDVDRRRSSGV